MAKGADDQAKDPSAPSDFETALKELESLIEKMEEGQLNLDDSVRHFEHGLKLIRHCEKSLQQAERKIQVLREQDDRPPQLEPLSPGDNEEDPQ